MKKLISLIGTLFLSGCISTQKTIPEIETFKKISLEKYILGFNDCSNMSGKYARELFLKGHKFRILMLKRKDAESYHALVAIPWKNKELYLDPAQRRVSYVFPKNYEFHKEINELEIFTNTEYMPSEESPEITKMRVEYLHNFLKDQGITD